MGTEIFELMKKHNQEQIAFYTDKSTKLRAILAIQSTALGPAIGGVRFYRYDSLDIAIYDLLRLSQGMTYKAAAGGINFGGGYLIVIEQEGMEKNEPLFRGIARFIQSFNGRFIAAEDIGVTDEHMEFMALETKHITGFPFSYSGITGHSMMCAYGTFIGIRAAAKFKWNSDNLSGKKIVIQGYGRVGARLAELTKNEGAEVVVTDINADRIKQAQKDGLSVIAPENVYSEPCHILSPCSIGTVINPENCEKFRCEVIAGSANNQMDNDNTDLLLKKRGILYAPDFIINSGAVINISEERLGGHYKKEEVIRKTEKIYDRLLEIFQNSEANDISPNQAAALYAQKRIDSIKELKGVHTANSHS